MKSCMENFEEVKEVKEYPCLKISGKDCVVLFYHDTVGIVVYSSNNEYPIGHYCETWRKSAFRLFDGVIKLSN